MYLKTKVKVSELNVANILITVNNNNNNPIKIKTRFGLPP